MGQSSFVRKSSILSGLSGQKGEEEGDTPKKSEKINNDPNQKKRKRKHKSYDKAARLNFKMKMLNQLQLSQGSQEADST